MYLPHELHTHILSYVYRYDDVIYASRVSELWRSIIEQLSKEIYDKSILEHNSYALNLYLQKENVNAINIDRIINFNCLNRVAAFVLVPDYRYKSVEPIGLCETSMRTFQKKWYIFRRFLVTNNISKPIYIKKLLECTLNGGIGFVAYLPKQDYCLCLCIKNNSIDIAKYLLQYSHMSRDFEFIKLLQFYDNDINFIFKHIQFLVDHHAINLPGLYHNIKYMEDFDNKTMLLEFCSGFMNGDVVGILNKIDI